MNKRLKVILPVVVLAFGMILGLPYYMGIKAEQTLNKQHTLLQDSVFIKVVERDYKRGWFSSEETTSLQLDPTFVNNYKNLLPEAWRELSGKTITYINRVYHGPFPKFQYIGRAYVQTQFQFSADTRKELENFFKDQEPIQLSNKINFLGGGQLKLNIPNFDYSETISGVKVNWQGLDYSVNYQDEFKSYLSDLDVPGLKITLGEKGEVSFEGLKASGNQTTGQASGAALGVAELTLAKLNVSWTEPIDYYINLDALISTLTNVKWDALFINPRGKIGPADLELNGLAFNLDIKEKDTFLNWVMQTKLDRLAYDKEVYGPLDVKISGDRFDAKSYIALVEKLKLLTTQNLEDGQYFDAALEAIKTEGLPFVMNNPQVNVETFKFKMPSGLLDIHGTFGLQDIQPEDLDDKIKFIGKIQVDMEAYMPQLAIETLVVNNVQAIFRPDERVDNQPDMDNIAESMVVVVRSLLNNMAEDGLIVLKDGIVHTKIRRKDDALYINDKKLSFEYEDEEDLFDDAPESSETVSQEGVVASSAERATSDTK